ncbi:MULTISPECIES: phage portal protein [unclassified Caballeronia]|uniref:phage portal protein n=1 Tax=unclassified Caballeronia TaxID=2646786 RepID=UPI00285FE6FA|nr:MULTISPECIES: phage portal protein [unclassified Caballeronia]MDR5777545.1 phage portal protein [Caballeronia sp. LZ002]MDR5800437.1 phage portal protein [Caballeronia sp. LZ001]MDR5801500.1 phage portal protein [Caballeronia sp. LZ001]MDR5853007.1 phage portal protein [Caballeronia sp. LZ003]
MFFSKHLLPSVGVSQTGLGGWISSLLGSVRSDSGQIVTKQSALSLTVLQACVTLLAESIAQLPIELYERSGDDRKPAVNHPLYSILKYEPNSWQTPFEYQEQSQLAVGLCGNSYSFIDRDCDGVVRGLYPLPSESVVVKRGGDLKPVYIAFGREPMPQRLIHHVRWITLDSYTGLSPILLHANAIGHSQAIQQYAGRSFLNGTVLSGVIERPSASPPIKDQAGVDRITDSWNAKFAGSGNAKKVALLQEGMTFKPLSMTNVDAALIDALRLSALDIARIYKIPAHMVNELERATFSNIEHQEIQFVIYTLLPWVKRHEQAKTRDLLLPSERKRYFIEYNLAGLLRGDQASRYAAYAVGRQWGWLSSNDIRRLENMPPVDGGDTYLSPLNMVDASKPLPMPPSEAQPTKAQVADVERILF